MISPSSPLTPSYSSREGGWLAASDLRLQGPRPSPGIPCEIRFALSRPLALREGEVAVGSHIVVVTVPGPRRSPGIPRSHRCACSRPFRCAKGADWLLELAQLLTDERSA